MAGKAITTEKAVVSGENIKAESYAGGAVIVAAAALWRTGSAIFAFGPII